MQTKLLLSHIVLGSILIYVIIEWAMLTQTYYSDAYYFGTGILSIVFSLASIALAVLTISKSK